MAFIADDCRRRGIGIARWPESAGDEAALDRVSQKSWRKPGLIRVDLSGRITGDRELAVTKVHRIEFEEMTEQQEDAFWRSSGF